MMGERTPAEVRLAMQTLGRQIMHHMDANPEDFDGREELWMQREDLRAELETLTRPTLNTWSQRLAVFLFGGNPQPAFGAGFIIFGVIT